MSISIVMLTYNNYEKFLRSMTSMFYFITEPKIKEFIFLDNGSHEIELKKFLRQLEAQISKVRVIFSDENLGIAKGRKVLYDVSRGDYIASFDSDIVIINPPLFLEIFYKSLEIPGMMMVGGGGGNHPYFPSLEKENIDNKESPDNPMELKVVDELAGWFHGFKTSLLTRNGGRVEMDEQFSPFWAEDSDFCMQVKVLGGKCCIMGKGVVAHQWSSCDKKKTQITLEAMWNKFQDKWYKIFGDDFVFNVEDKFYEANYPKSKEMLRRREFYHKVGMIEGHLYSKEQIKYLFPDVKFLNNTTISFENNKYTINEFNLKFFRFEEIVKRNYKILGGNLPKNIKDLTILTVFDLEKGLEIIRNLISIQRCYITLVLIPGIHPAPFVEIFKKYDCPFLITEFINFNFDLIPYIVTAKIMMINYKIENILNLSTERNNSEYLTRPLDTFQPGYYLENQVQKMDKYCLSFLDQILTLNNTMMWNSDCIYYEKTEYLQLLFDSLPLMNTLVSSMKIPRNYTIHISPRCSPKHSLERVIGYIKQKIRKEKSTYYTIICDINDEDDIEKIVKNISYFKNGEICIINKGKMKKISHKIIPYDFYMPVENMDKAETLMLLSLSNIELSNYSNFVFCDDSFEITEPITEFLERCIYKNHCFCKKNNEYDTSFFSVVLDHIVEFGNGLKEENFVLKDYLKNTSTRSHWISTIQEKDEETIIEYSKPGLDDGEDYPLI